MPHIETHLTPLVIALDMSHRTAAIPGNSGDEIVSFTYTKDLGRFVVAALSLPKWEEALHCYSENATFNQLVQAAEEVTGEHHALTKVNKINVHQGASSTSLMILLKNFSVARLLSFHPTHAHMTLFQSHYLQHCWQSSVYGPSMASYMFRKRGP